MIKRTFYFGLIVLAYLVFVNLVAGIPKIDLNAQNRANGQISNADINVDFGDSVEFTVERKRWYGKIIETSEKSNLLLGVEIKSRNEGKYFIKLFPIPLKSPNFNFKYWHISFFVVICVSYIYAMYNVYKNERRNNHELDNQNVFIDNFES